MKQTVDVTPTPRILATLGEIPFEVWQCLAELIDNSIDASRRALASNPKDSNLRIDITWAGESLAHADREIVVQDNGAGMELQKLQDAARAGFTSNDPIRNLGLFGMGFNIATARLGDETRFLSATEEMEEWVGIAIDFEELVKGSTFAAPVITMPKEHPEDCGTRVIIRKLKTGVHGELSRRHNTIRRRLESIYSPLLVEGSIPIFLQGVKLRPHRHCVWSANRFVTRRGQRVSAVREIDNDLGETWFDQRRNRYLSVDECAEVDYRTSRNEEPPPHIVKRKRKLRGWLGIQRYSDPSDYGIDFVRNGRKILVADKSLFQYENPDLGTWMTEYPVELGSTVGGRIVGELHVDYLIPTYQKNAFDKTDLAWQRTVESVRGAGPLLPKKRKALGYDGDNTSPLGLLVNAFRRNDHGTKHLSIPKEIAREFLANFRAGEEDYIEDDKWYKAAQEVDREKAELDSPADSGAQPSDDVEAYGPDDGDELHDPEPDFDNHGDANTPTPVTADPSTPVSNTNRESAIADGIPVESLSGPYSYENVPGFQVSAYRARQLQLYEDGFRIPYVVFQDGVSLDFVYDETHAIIAEYPITPRQLLLSTLAEKFAVRDAGRTTQKRAYMGLVNRYMADERINNEAIKERAIAVYSRITERLPSLLSNATSEALELIRRSPSDEEYLANQLLEEDPALLGEYQQRGERANEVLAFISVGTLIRLVEKMPTYFMDDKVFKIPFDSIQLNHSNNRDRVRQAAIDQVTSYLRDLKAIIQDGLRRPKKSEQIRFANTLTVLESRIA